jgi:hypothetical protein
MEAALKMVGPVLQQGMAMMKQIAPPPPMDPALAAVQAAGAETQRKTAADQAGQQLKQQDQQAQQALDQEKNAILSRRNDIMEQGQELEASTRAQTTAEDNQTALDIAETRIASGRQPGYKNGESMTE